MLDKELKMNILLISPYFSPAVGGVETHLNDLCKYLSSKKHTIFVRTYKSFGVNNRGQTDENKKFVKIHRLWWPDFNLIFKLERSPILKFTYLFLGIFLDCLIFLLRNHKKINVIQAHGFIGASVAVILGKVFEKRVVINTHVSFNLSSGLITKIIKLILLSSAKILVLTSGIKKSLIDLGIPDEKIDIYHYWVDQKIFNKIKNAKSKLGWDNKFVILFVGRLIEVKGIRMVFKLAEKFKNIHFVIAGSGPLSEEVKEQLKTHKNIIFLGKVDNQDLPIYYSASDILLIPSKIIKQKYEEGIPRVMIEALYCCLPVISTKSGGIPDIFDKKIGVLVEDDIASIINAIKLFNQDRSVLRGLKKNCRSYALKFFGINNARIIEASLK